MAGSTLSPSMHMSFWSSVLVSNADMSASPSPSSSSSYSDEDLGEGCSSSRYVSLLVESARGANSKRVASVFSGEDSVFLEKDGCRRFAGENSPPLRALSLSLSITINRHIRSASPLSIHIHRDNLFCPVHVHIQCSLF